MRLLIPAAFLAFFVASCSGEATKPKQVEENTEVEVAEVVDNHATAPAVTAYMDLKRALVESNAEESQLAAERFKNALNEIAAEDSLVEVISVASDSLGMTTDLNVQRSAFGIISDNFYLYLRANGHGRALYRQYCPMAFNNEGAYWLAEEKAINNPYLPETMLKCGRVDEEL